MPTKTAKPTALEESLIRGMREAVAFERGKLPNVRVRRVPVTARQATATPAPVPKRAAIVDLRTMLQLSQAVFADALNVSAATVRSWEQGMREPDGAVLRLLELAGEHPEWILAKVRPTRAIAHKKAPLQRAGTKHTKAVRHR